MHWGPTHVISSIYVLKNRVWSLKLSRGLLISNAINYHTIKINSENSKALFEGFIFGEAYIWRGLCMEGNLHFKIDWASLILGRKLTIFLSFTLYSRAIFKYKPLEGAWGAYIWRGNLTEGILHYEFGGLIFGGAYTFQNFTVFNNIIILSNISLCLLYF